MSTRSIPWPARALAVTAGLLAAAVVVACTGSGSGSSSKPKSTTRVVHPASVDPAAPDPLVCPKAVGQPTRHQRTGSGTRMVPGEPLLALVCRYGPEGTLARAATFMPGVLASALNRPPPIPPARPYSCPAALRGTGTIRVLFRYPDNGLLVVAVAASGCRFAWNGDRTVLSPSLIERLDKVVG